MNTANRSRIVVIGACTTDGAYGLGSGMPWPKGKAGLPGDMLRFRSVTGNAEGNKINLLIAGRVTAETMQDVDLRPNRLLVSVSRHHPQELITKKETLSRHQRIAFAKSFNETLEFIDSPIVDKIIFVGGRACWEFGMSVAEKAYITLAQRECPGNEYTRLSTPLDKKAEESGFTLTKKESLTNPVAWSSVYSFLEYTKT